MEIDEEISLQDYIRVLRKRKWTIFTVTITAIIAVLIANFLMQPVTKPPPQFYFLRAAALRLFLAVLKGIDFLARPMKWKLRLKY